MAQSKAWTGSAVKGLNLVTNLFHTLPLNNLEQTLTTVETMKILSVDHFNFINAVFAIISNKSWN